MAEVKDERVYNVNTLTKVFLWASLGLLACVIAMAWLDYSRPWKDYQRKFMHLQRSRIKESYAEAKNEVDWNQVNQLKTQLSDASKELETHTREISDLEDQQGKLDAQIYKFNKDYLLERAQIDAAKYDYSEHFLKEGKVNSGLKKKIDDLVDEASALNQKVFELKKAQDQILQKLADLSAKRDDAKDQIKKLTANLTLLRTKFHNLDFDFLFMFRNAMLLDFMSPTIQVKQIVLKNLPEDLYFAKTMRVDRCITCHLAIDQKGFEDAPQPFRTHPKLDLYLGASSPHPLNKIGCTVCHGGVGQAVNFNTCAHVPNDEDQAKVWTVKYNWKEPEGVPVPMLPLKYTEGSCLKCHGTQQHVNFAPKLDKGRELMVVRGCVGCHKVKNLENMPKAGPNLLKVKGKLKKEFVLKWVWAPKSFNPEAKMPSYFQQTNNSDEEGLAKTKTEMTAIVNYLFTRSADYQPKEAPGPGKRLQRQETFQGSRLRGLPRDERCRQLPRQFRAGPFGGGKQTFPVLGLYLDTRSQTLRSGYPHAQPAPVCAGSLRYHGLPDEQAQQGFRVHDPAPGRSGG